MQFNNALINAIVQEPNRKFAQLRIVICKLYDWTDHSSQLIIKQL